MADNYSILGSDGTTVTVASKQRAGGEKGNRVYPQVADADVSAANPVPVAPGAGATFAVAGSVAVSNFPAAQPVTAAALPLPAGAATDATLAGQVAGCANLAVTQVTVDATAGGVVLAAARAGRRSVTVTNLGTTDVWVGAGAVTAAAGELLVGVKGASVTYLYAGELKAVAAAGSQAVSVREEY